MLPSFPSRVCWFVGSSRAAGNGDGNGDGNDTLRRCPLKMFGSGDMVLHADAKTDAKSMAAYAENFYALEEAVSRETTRLRTASD